jgi:YHS domain-containing protein
MKTKMSSMGLAALALGVIGGFNAPLYAQCGSCGSMMDHSGAAMTSHTSHSARSTASLSELKLVGLDGETVAMGSYLGQRPLVLLVAGADSASRLAAQTVEKARGKSDKDGPAFLGIVDAGSKQASSLKTGLKLGYQVIPDPDKRVLAALESEDVPLVAFFDRSGKQVQSERLVTDETIAEGIKATAGPMELVDPVCKMTVTKETAAATYLYKGTTYYFCNKACKDNFAKDPQKYLSQ